jgi:transketolase C-terminal domain/subunit
LKTGGLNAGFCFDSLFLYNRKTMNERFGQVGTLDFLQKEYGLDRVSIKQQIVGDKVSL